MFVQSVHVFLVKLTKIRKKSGRNVTSATRICVLFVKWKKKKCRWPRDESVWDQNNYLPTWNLMLPDRNSKAWEKTQYANYSFCFSFRSVIFFLYAIFIPFSCCCFCFCCCSYFLLRLRLLLSMLSFYKISLYSSIKWNIIKPKREKGLSHLGKRPKQWKIVESIMVVVVCGYDTKLTVNRNNGVCMSLVNAMVFVAFVPNTHNALALLCFNQLIDHM